MMAQYTDVYIYIVIFFLLYLVGEFVHSQPTNHSVEIQWNLTKQTVQLYIGDHLSFAIPEKLFSMYYTNDSTVQGKLLIRRKGKGDLKETSNQLVIIIIYFENVHFLHAVPGSYALRSVFYSTRMSNFQKFKQVN